jgi:thiol peroxidase
MATVKFKGNEVHTSGKLPEVGTQAHDFTLVGQGLNEIHLKDYRGKRVVLNIFPSLDTPTCAMSVRKFNQWMAKKENVVVICISKDLPFAQARFCGAEGLNNVITASDFRNPAFAQDYGVLITDSPLKGLMTRAVIAIDESGKVVYTQLVDEISEEPSYDVNVF